MIIFFISYCTLSFAVAKDFRSLLLNNGQVQCFVINSTSTPSGLSLASEWR